MRSAVFYLSLAFVIACLCGVGTAQTCTPADGSGCPASLSAGPVTGSSPAITIGNCGGDGSYMTGVAGNNPGSCWFAWPSGSNPAQIGRIVCFYGGGFSSGTGVGCPATNTPKDLIMTAEQTGRAVYTFNYTLATRSRLNATMSIGATTIQTNALINLPTTYPYNMTLDVDGANQETFSVTSATGNNLNVAVAATKTHTGNGSCVLTGNNTVVSTCVPILAAPIAWPRPWQDAIALEHYIAAGCGTSGNQGTSSCPGNPFNTVNWGQSAGSTLGMLAAPSVETSFSSLGWNNTSAYTAPFRITGMAGGEPAIDFGNLTISSANTTVNNCGDTATGIVPCDGTGALAISRLIGCYPITNPSSCWTLAENASPYTYWSTGLQSNALRLQWADGDATVPPPVDESALITALSGISITVPFTLYGTSATGHVGEYCSGPCISGTAAQVGNPNSSTLTGYVDTISWINGLSGCVLTPLQFASGTSGTAYSQTVTKTNCTASQSFSATGLPSPLTINSSTGVISGTTSSSGTFNVTVAYNGSGTSAEGYWQGTLTIVGSSTPPSGVFGGAIGAGVGHLK